ncbi:hypothetical protein FH972_023887 [Carpinus fangiana]|uniref:Calcineurin-like phosphoesterase domain-containing protein n=1 Tax=Carpinus fangiana TaxID=176857 RepID=A0A5N6KWH8_9ROSI|nr:hypothetical protein FH972_023887 [Carpinus fangiana]
MSAKPLLGDASIDEEAGPVGSFDNTTSMARASLPVSLRSIMTIILVFAAICALALHSSPSPPKKAGNPGKDVIQVQRLDTAHIPKAKTPKGKRGKRLVVVGDVHGCSSELSRLLKRISFDAKFDHLILAGDMIDKGPDSHGVLALAQSLDATCIRGNHEDNLLRSHFSPTEYPPSNKISILEQNLDKKDIDYLLSCPLILSLGNIPSLETRSSVVVHAGLVPHVKLEKQPPWHVMHMRTMSKHFEPSEERDGDPWWSVWHTEQKKLHKKERMTVLYGHDSRMGLVEKRFSVGLDTGCVRGGRLTALVLGGKGDKEIVSVRCQDYT